MYTFWCFVKQWPTFVITTYNVRGDGEQITFALDWPWLAVGWWPNVGIKVSCFSEVASIVFFASKYHSKKSSIKFGQHLKEKLSPKPFANILIWSHWLLGTLHSHGIITTYNVAHRASWISHTPFQGHQKALFTALLSNNMSLYRS